ncbi:MAG: hypothetical protein IKT00_08760 [Prevotella sp.]|nr:hypothetical protein [Prevotella sp.]
MVNLILKKSLIPILAILILTGCKDSYESCHLSKGIDAILSDYVDRYSEDSVITLQFYKVENRTILNIQHSPFYPFKEYVDGCFLYKDKLVLYCLLDKSVLVDSLIDTTFTSDKTILNNYKSWEDVDCEIDGHSDCESYIVKSRNKIVKAVKTDFVFKERASDTIGIRNNSINNLINQRLNNHNAPITAIRFASFENNDYFMISEVNLYAKKTLSGCLKRNGRILTFYGLEKLRNPDVIDIELIQKNLSLLNNHKEISSKSFDFESSEGDLYKILPKGNVEKVSVEELSDEKYEMLYKALGF